MEKYLVIDSNSPDQLFTRLPPNRYNVYIPPDFYNDFGDGNYEVEMITNQQGRGITGNVGYWTVEVDMPYANVANTGNDAYNIIQYRDGASTSDIRIGEPIKAIVNGKPNVFGFKFVRSDGVDINVDQLFTNGFCMVFKFTPVKHKKFRENYFGGFYTGF